MADSKLILGWRIDEERHPKFWVRNGEPDYTKATDADLLQVPTKSLDRHLLLVAQSGSGKSFFLGRLVEEILTKTLANVVIIDPNGDYVDMDLLRSESDWSKPKYDVQKRKGFLPTSTRGDFVDIWKDVTFSRRSNRKENRKGDSSCKKVERPCSFSLANLEWDAAIPHGLSTGERLGLSAAHHFVAAVESAVINAIVQKQREENPAAPKEYCEPLDPKWVDSLFTKDDEQLRKAVEARIVQEKGKFDKDSVRRILDRAISRRRCVSEQEWNLYRHIRDGLVADGVARFDALRPSDMGRGERLDVIDLSSCKSSTHDLVVATTLSELMVLAQRDWFAAQASGQDDVRVPTFIVVDEAHRFVPHPGLNSPAEENGSVSRDILRTIAAEGRKYGLFLILSSQRPTKLDPSTISECDNFCIMKYSGEGLATLPNIGRDSLQRCRHYETGRGVLCGHWVDGIEEEFYCAMRSTVEGGASLRADHWAKSPVTTER